MGVRGVAAQLEREGYGKVGKSAVAEWLRADRARRAGAAEAAEGPPARADRPKKAAARPEPPPGPPRPTKPTKAPSRREQAPEDACFDEAALTAIDPEALDFAELVQLDEEVSRFRREAYADRDERRYAVLARLKLDVRQALEKMRPAPKVDPATDPVSLEARAAVLARLAKMVENAQAAAAGRTAPPAPAGEAS
jgi:hypothetical protein